MKKRAVKSLGKTMVALSALVAPQAAMAATGALTVSAVIVPSPLALTSPQDLRFGGILESGGGTVEIDTIGGANYVGGVSAGTSPAVQEGLLKLFGNTGSNVNITVTNPTIALTNGTTTMQVDNVNVNTNAGGASEIVNMGTNNTQIVPVGATLHVNPGQPTGTYTGTFNINANY